VRALVELIEKYRPGFAATVVPAEEEEVELLDERVGPLPGAYQRFLHTMGSSMGDFHIDEGSFSADAILSTYGAMEWLVRNRYLLVGVDGSLTSDWDYFLDRNFLHARDDARVVRIRQDPACDPDGHMLCHAGLEEMLYYEAYATIRLPLLAYKVGLRRPRNEARAQNCRAEVACALAEELKFKRVPPATRCALYERGDAAILLYQHPVEPAFSLEIAGDDAREVARLAEIFRSRAGVIDAR